MKWKGSSQGILKVDEKVSFKTSMKESFYFHEIIGCVVRTTSGDELGVVKEILSPGANDVWVVKAPGERSISSLILRIS